MVTLKHGFIGFFFQGLCFVQLFSVDLNVQHMSDIISVHPEIKERTFFESYFFSYPVISGIIDAGYSGYTNNQIVYEIPNGEVVSYCRLLRIDNAIIPDFARDASLRDKKVLQFVESVDTPKRIKGRVVALTEAFIGCYYHFMELIMQISLLKRHTIPFDYVYTVSRKPFQIELLRLLGIPASRIIDASIYPHIVADTLLVSKNFGVVPGFHKNDLAFIRSSILAKTVKKKMSYAKKIFISRKDSHKRKLLNEDEIFSLFKIYGFKRYELSKYSVIEQAALFYGADCIVACHGAGLTNLMFCKKNTKIVEMFQLMKSPLYAMLSHDMSLDYKYLILNQFDTEKRHTSTYIDPELIKNFIKEHDLWLR